MKLYEIEQNYLSALDLFTDPEVDIPPETVADTLEAITGEFQEKAIAVAAFAKQMEAEANAIKQVEESMAKRRRSLEARAHWLLDYVKTGMELLSQKKISSTWFVLSIQKNPVAVDVYNADTIPDEFKHTVIEIKIDKTAIKSALGLGREIPGARLTQGTRLAIK